MINFDDYVNENKTKHNEKWPYIPDHPYRLLIIGGSGSGETSVLLNLRNEKNEQKWTKFICMQEIWTNQSMNIWLKNLKM